MKKEEDIIEKLEKSYKKRKIEPDLCHICGHPLENTPLKMYIKTFTVGDKTQYSCQYRDSVLWQCGCTNHIKQDNHPK